MIWKGEEINRGQFVTSIKNLSNEVGLSLKAVRVAIMKLKRGKEIDTFGASQYTKITVCNYDTYQSLNSSEGQAKNDNQGKPRANEGQQYKNKKNNKNTISFDFEEFWNQYDKKTGNKIKLNSKWLKLSAADKSAILEYIPKYKLAQPEKQFRKNPETFLNNRSWEDEIISSETPKKQPEQQASITPQSAIDAITRAGIGSQRN